MSEDPSVYLRPTASRTVYDQTKAFDSKKWFWVPDDEEGFKSAFVKSTRGEKVLLEMPDSSVSHRTCKLRVVFIVLVWFMCFSAVCLFSLLGERGRHEHH